MTSAAKIRFDLQLARADLLSSQAGRLKRSADIPTKTVLLHAALTTQVAAWDVYVKAVAREYFSCTARPTDAPFSAFHELLYGQLEKSLVKLNTPNSENSRNILLSFTKFDPWPYWINIKFNGATLSSSLLCRNLMDEIFKLRHSFAHGLALPAYSWNADPSGSAKLNCEILRNTRFFFAQVCRNTDIGLSNHIATQHGVNRPW
jgi:hypothetical protein